VSYSYHFTICFPTYENTAFCRLYYNSKSSHVTTIHITTILEEYV